MKRPTTEKADTVEGFDTGYIGVILPNDDNEPAFTIHYTEDFWGQFESLHLNESDKSLFWYHVPFGYTVKEK